MELQFVFYTLQVFSLTTSHHDSIATSSRVEMMPYKQVSITFDNYCTLVVFALFSSSNRLKMLKSKDHVIIANTGVVPTWGLAGNKCHMAGRKEMSARKVFEMEKKRERENEEERKGRRKKGLNRGVWCEV